MCIPYEGTVRLGGSIGRSLARSIAREITVADKRHAGYRRLQREAAARPESRRVQTPAGEFWMSPIEAELYEAMCREGLSSIPQFYIRGYYVDFAFPDVRVAVEADGAAFHGPDRRERDRKRDWILLQAGWTVRRFHGTTIHRKAANCAYVIKREVEGRRNWIRARALQRERKREARRAAFLWPFRKVRKLLQRNIHTLGASGGISTASPRPKSPGK